MARALAAAALVWLLLLAGALVLRASNPASVPATLIYLTASRVCHQRADRSFRTAGVVWPVCARCAGLYLAAPAGAWLALVAGARRRPGRRTLFALAAAPTLATLALEWSGAAPIGNLARHLAAWPLGAAVAWILVDAARDGRAKAIG